MTSTQQLLFSRVYHLVNVGWDDREAALESLEERFSQFIGEPHGPLFAGSGAPVPNRAELESALIRLWEESGPGVPRILAAALVVLCDLHRKDLNAERAYRAFLRLAEMVRSIPKSSASVVIYQADARALPVEANSVDLVVTSPPYINVHNYHQKFRRSVEALGWNVLDIAPSEIGSNRQNRGNRFVTVIQYALDMALAIREMARIAKPASRLILVLGRESTVRGVPFFNGELVAELAGRGAELTNERRQERQFVNRFGNKIREDILHFRKSSDIPDEKFCLEVARSIASQTLSTTRKLTTIEARRGIDDALERIDQVVPSPLPSDGDLSQVLS